MLESVQPGTDPDIVPERKKEPEPVRVPQPAQPVPA
jgi:hypothetical protein